MMSKSLMTFVPAEDFTGYPQNKKTEFKAGVESIPVSETFVELMREKGHVAKGTLSHEPKADKPTDTHA